MKTLTLIALLVTSQFTHAMSASEQQCLAASIYHECRSEPEKWLECGRVAVLRQSHCKAGFSDYGASSCHLCDIVKSEQYQTSTLLSKPKLERVVYSKIKSFVIRNNFTGGRYAYFSARRGKTTFRKSFRG
jgi:hypothetical protein